MLQLEQVHSIDFSLYRALLRAMMLKNPEPIAAFIRSFGFEPLELLNGKECVSQEFLIEFWTAAGNIQRAHPFLILDAASLFQWSDLGEKGWVLTTARDLSSSLELFQKFFPCLNVGLEDSEHFLLCRQTPDQSVPVIALFYFSFLALNFLTAQGIQLAQSESFVLPETCKPMDVQIENLLIERILRDYRVNIRFAGQDMLFSLNRETLSKPLKTADEGVFHFFLQRCIKHQLSHELNSDVIKNTKAIDKVKKILLRHISSSQFGSRDVAEEMGVSIRSLERLLAQDHQTLRSLKQQVQQEAAEEMLSMGMRGKEVAAQIGFRDVTAFSRAFHNWTGIPPSQFRKKKNDGKQH